MNRVGLFNPDPLRKSQNLGIYEMGGLRKNGSSSAFGFSRRSQWVSYLESVYIIAWLLHMCVK